MHVVWCSGATSGRACYMSSGSTAKAVLPIRIMFLKTRRDANGRCVAWCISGKHAPKQSEVYEACVVPPSENLH